MSWCASCGFEDSQPFKRCPNCHSDEVSAEYHVETPLTPLSDVEPEDETIRLDKIMEEPKPGVRTGTALDHLGENALPQGAVVLLFGSPGAGKSRLSLCAASGWCAASGGQALYQLLESMPPKDLRRMAREHHLSNLSSIIVTTRDYEPADVMDLIERRPVLAIIDSSCEIDAARGLVETVADYSDSSAILIAQETKEGLFAGFNSVAHTVSIVCRLVLDLGTGVRTLQVTKNRFGLSGIFPVPWPPFLHDVKPKKAGNSAKRKKK
jgi:predicted ATP-dependent serine protease